MPLFSGHSHLIQDHSNPHTFVLSKHLFNMVTKLIQNYEKISFKQPLKTEDLCSICTILCVEILGANLDVT